MCTGQAIHLQRLLLEKPAVSKDVLHCTLVVQHIQRCSLTILLSLAIHGHTAADTCTAVSLDLLAILCLAIDRARTIQPPHANMPGTLPIQGMSTAALHNICVNAADGA